jgi:hypothetical protein
MVSRVRVLYAGKTPEFVARLSDDSLKDTPMKRNSAKLSELTAASWVSLGMRLACRSIAPNAVN